MARRARLPFAAAALVALAVAAIPGSPAGGAGRVRPKVTPAAFVMMEYFGVIGITRPGAGRSPRAFASLHGLAEGKTYEAAGVTKGCAVDLDAAGVEQAAVFELPITTETGRTDAFVTRPIALRRRATMRSMRLYETLADGTIRQLGCSQALSGAALGAGVGG